MYNIFITPKSGTRQLIAQVSDCRAFLRKRYNDLIPVTADLDHAMWRTNDGTHIEAHAVVEKIFDVPLQEEPQKVDPKGKPERESGWYWIRIPGRSANLEPCWWDGSVWYVDKDYDQLDDCDLLHIYEVKLQPPQLSTSIRDKW